MTESNEPDLTRRFGGIIRLYGKQALTNFSEAHVCVIGIGGVGSWAAEALARTGIGQFTLIDMDHVAESNINRQLQALTANLGKNKIQVMSDRISQINPICQVHQVDDFITVDNLDSHLHNRMDFVIDCIDDFRTKAALIDYCKTRQIKLVTTGGAGGKRNPGKIRLTDLARSEQDPLLAKTRSLLRQKYRFPRNLKKKFNIPCVWSEEPQVFLWDNGELCPQRPDTIGSQSLNCGGLGSSMPVTATGAHFAVAYVLDELAEQA